jgi:pimeloyl-ACP methyl ester carboxylesterase
LYVSQLFPGLFAPNFAETQPDLIQTVIAQGKKQSPEGIMTALQGMIDRKEQLDTLEQLRCPVLMLLGAEDALIPRMWVQDMIHRPHLADVRLLPATGHMSMLEAPEHCSAIIRAFYELCLRS